MTESAHESPEEQTLDAVMRAAFEPSDTPPENFDRIVDAVRDATAARAQRGRAPRLAASDAFDRYELGEPIGAGGMGVVYRGRDPNFGRDVAVKVLSDEHAADASFVERFIEEAQIGGQLEHPGIVPVHEVGYRPDGRPYFTMKLVDGATLSELLAVRAEPTDDRRRFLSIFERICETVGYAHARGVVHRDLKPHNIMVGKFGEVQIMDWGLAKVLAAPARPRPGADDLATVRSAPDAVRSASGSVMGTAAYVPPEQARGEVAAVDARADVFALGAILCEILTGAPAYAGPAETLWEKARTGDLADAFERIAHASADDELRGIAREALSPSPDARPADAGVVAEHFHRYRSTQEKRARASALAASRARMRLAVVVAVAVVLLAVGVTLYWREHDRADRARRAEADAATAIDELRDAHVLAVERGDVPTWRAAAAAASRARAWIERGAIDDTTIRRIERLADAVEVGHAVAVRADETRRHDATTRAALERLRLMPRPFDHAARAARYAAVFRDYGVGVADLDDDRTRAALETSALRDALVDGLDGWLTAAIRFDSRLAARIGELACRLDRDRPRAALRAAVLARDGDRAAAIAGALTPASSPGAVRLGGFLLGALGASEPAIARLRDAVEEHPDDFWMRAHLVHCLEVVGSWDDALAHAAVLRALRPDSPMVWARTARLLEHAGRPDDAARTARRALELDETCATAHAVLATVLADRGEADAAIAALRRAIEHDRFDAPLHVRLGRMLMRRDRAAAEAAFEQAVQSSRHYVPAWQALARLRMARGDVGGACEAHRAIIRAGERLAAVPAAVDETHSRMGLDAQAAVDQARFSLAVLLVQTGRNDEAGRVARRAIARAPNDPRAWGVLASSLDLRGRYDDALSAYAKVREHDRGRGRAILDRLIAECERKRATVETLKRIDAGEARPTTHEGLMHLAEVALATGRVALAAELSRDAADAGDGSLAFYERAAIAAARTAAGDGVDCATLTAEVRTAWREHAREWLLRAIDAHATTPPPQRRVALHILAHHAAFDRVRDPAALRADERAAWRSVWKRLDTVAGG